MFNEITNRTPSDAVRKTAGGFNRALTTLSLAVYLGAILLWQVAGTRAASLPSGLTQHGMGGAPRAAWWSPRQPLQPLAQNTIQFDRRGFFISEAGPFGEAITVTRLGDLSREATVDFATSDRCPDTALCTRLASERSDYVRAAGTLRFAPGEASQMISITVIDDALVEGDELFFLTLRNAVGASLGAQSTVMIIITDNDSDPAAQNPIDTSLFFVRMHYLDFLGREPEPDGLNAWVGVLNRCPNAFNLDSNDPSAGCDRIIVSSSFFRSAEFELKGYFVYLFYKTSLGRRPTYAEFIGDLPKISGQSAAEVTARKAEYTAAWVERAEFKALYESHVEPSAFVDRLLHVSGLTLGGEVTRDSLVQDLQAGKEDAGGNCARGGRTSKRPHDGIQRRVRDDAVLRLPPARSGRGGVSRMAEVSECQPRRLPHDDPRFREFSGVPLALRAAVRERRANMEESPAHSPSIRIKQRTEALRLVALQKSD